MMVGVGPNKAPWKCLSKNGVVAEVMSMTDEGALSDLKDAESAGEPFRTLTAPRLSYHRDRLFSPICAGDGAFRRRHLRSFREPVRAVGWRLLGAFGLALEPNDRCLP